MEVPMAVGRPESGVGVERGAACTTGKHGQFPFASGGTGDSGADRFAECGWKDEPTDCPTIGIDQRHGGQVAAALRGTGRGGAAWRTAPPAAAADQRWTKGPIGGQKNGGQNQRAPPTGCG